MSDRIKGLREISRNQTDIAFRIKRVENEFSDCQYTLIIVNNVYVIFVTISSPSDPCCSAAITYYRGCFCTDPRFLEFLELSLEFLSILVWASLIKIYTVKLVCS